MGSAEVTDTITHAEARQIAYRYNASHWDKPSLGEKARYSIPANPRRDDDLRLAAYIDQQEQRALTAEAEVARLREALENIAEGTFTVGFPGPIEIARTALEPKEAEK